MVSGFDPPSQLGYVKGSAPFSLRFPVRLPPLGALTYAVATHGLREHDPLQWVQGGRPTGNRERAEKDSGKVKLCRRQHLK